jgi:serine/tyrosine/threonine adenylyltransferase
LQLTIHDRFTRALPADGEARNFCRQVRGACYSYVTPSPASAPRLIAWSREVAELLGIEWSWLESESAARILSGTQLLPGMKPYAMCYGGHQFGNWAGQLGDGRAINLGEVMDRHGVYQTLQLKGAGVTPYSRSADGLAVLRSSLREFLCSEAMHHLGVPTTRALSLVLTGDLVTRDMFYDGRPRREPGAIVCRVAPSFTRFGNFEILASRNDTENLRKLVAYTIECDYSHLDRSDPNVYREWFKEICARTADMIARWMQVGFVHGVMNTDNMSILGQTIDYGPYGWIDGYQLDWTPNTTDAEGRRYCYGNQPQIGQWNVLQLANALWDLFGEEAPLRAGLDEYARVFDATSQSMMASKLGLKSWNGEEDQGLANELIQVLQLVETDMTIFFRKLANITLENRTWPEIRESLDDNAILAWIGEAHYVPSEMNAAVLEKTKAWLVRYTQRLMQDQERDSVRIARMHQANPKFVLRNYLAQQAIDKAEAGDYSEIDQLLDVLRLPYDEQPGRESYSMKRPDWARNKAGCSMLSCSS